MREHRHEVVLARRPPVEWFEIVAENYLVPAVNPSSTSGNRDFLLRRHYARAEELAAYPGLVAAVEISFGEDGQEEVIPEA